MPSDGCIWLRCPGWRRRLWTCCKLVSRLWEAGLVSERLWGVPSSMLQGGPTDGWALISSRQTCHRKHLPSTFTETNTSLGRGGREPQNNWILPHFLQGLSADCQLFNEQNMIYICPAPLNNKAAESSIDLETIPQKCVLGVCHLLIFPLHSVQDYRIRLHEQ